MMVQCGPCDETFSVGANAVDTRKVAGLYLVAATCPSCGRESVGDVGRDVFVRIDRWLVEERAAIAAEVGRFSFELRHHDYLAAVVASEARRG
jgi:hypothetical protein